MGDLISRKALLKELRKELRECRKDGDEFGGESILWAEGIEFAIDAVKEAPTIDAVEVVRCKDCKHMYRRKGLRWCDAWGEINGMGDDGFCNYGERRGEENAGS